MNATDDWYDVEEIAPGSYRITEAGDYGCFLVEGAELSVVVDAGAGVGDLRGLVEGLTDRPVTLVLTHTHWDHIGAASEFEDVRVHGAELPADGVVRLDSLTDEFVDRPAQFLERWTGAGYDLPEGVTADSYGVDPAPAEALGGAVDLGDRELEVVHLPGHSPGHVGLLDPATGILYGGDLVHYERDVYAMFEGCDPAAYVDSLKRAVELRDEAFGTLATSHNDPLTGADLDLLEELAAGLRGILAGERTPETVETDWGPAHAYQVGPSTVLTHPD